MQAAVNQVVGYIAPPAKAGGKTTTKRAVVLEGFGDGSARLDLTERTADGSKAKADNESLGHHTALANYDESKTAENSWHVLADEPTTTASAPRSTTAAA